MSDDVHPSRLEGVQRIAREQGDEAAMNWRRAEKARYDDGRGSVLDEVEA